MNCPKCGRNSNGKFCSYCGTRIYTDAEGSLGEDYSRVDFVPEDEEWSVDTNNEYWEDPDLDETIVLEPVDTYEPGQERTLYESDAHLESPDLSEEEVDEEEISPADEIWREKLQRDAGRKVDEKYLKYGRDPYDVPKTDRKKLKKDSVSRKEEIRHSKETKEKSAQGIEKVSAHTEIRLASFLMMLLLNLRLFVGFWSQRETLGQLEYIFSDSNYGQMLYILLAFLTCFYGFICIFWILSKKKKASGGRLIKYDAGRGLMPFLLYILITLLASRAVGYLPEPPRFLGGLTMYFQVLLSCQTWTYILGALGVITCIIRKILK